MAMPATTRVPRCARVQSLTDGAVAATCSGRQRTLWRFGRTPRLRPLRVMPDELAPRISGARRPNRPRRARHASVFDGPEALGLPGTLGLYRDRGVS